MANLVARLRHTQTKQLMGQKGDSQVKEVLANLRMTKLKDDREMLKVCGKTKARETMKGPGWRPESKHDRVRPKDERMIDSG